MKIYVTYLNNGYEGKSEPLGAFATNELAQIFQRGSAESFGTTVEIKELEIIGDLPSADGLPF